MPIADHCQLVRLEHRDCVQDYCNIFYFLLPAIFLSDQSRKMCLVVPRHFFLSSFCSLDTWLVAARSHYYARLGPYIQSTKKEEEEEDC